jgi:hypothetical protein
VTGRRRGREDGRARGGLGMEKGCQLREEHHWDEGLRRGRGRAWSGLRRRLMPPLSAEGDGGGVGSGQTED